MVSDSLIRSKSVGFYMTSILFYLCGGEERDEMKELAGNRLGISFKFGISNPICRADKNF